MFKPCIGHTYLPFLSFALFFSCSAGTEQENKPPQAAASANTPPQEDVSANLVTGTVPSSVASENESGALSANNLAELKEFAAFANIFESNAVAASGQIEKNFKTPIKCPIGQKLDPPTVSEKTIGDIKIKATTKKIYFSLEENLHDGFLVFLGERMDSLPPEEKLEVLGCFTGGSGKKKISAVVRNATTVDAGATLLYRTIRVFGRIDDEEQLFVHEEGSSKEIHVAKIQSHGYHRQVYGKAGLQ